MEQANANASIAVTLSRGGALAEGAEAHGRYVAECYGPDRVLKWRDTIENVVCTEGKDAALQHFLKGSAYTASNVLGLIGNTSYGAGPVAGNTAASITTASGAPANGWNESTVVSARGTPTIGTPSGGSVSLSSSVSFSITGTDTIRGAFVLCRSAAGTAPTTATGNTNGAIWSAGTFSGGDRSVANGDTLNVSYTTSL